jgi:hypothetical protein
MTKLGCENYFVQGSHTEHHWRSSKSPLAQESESACEDSSKVPNN